MSFVGRVWRQVGEGWTGVTEGRNKWVREWGKSVGVRYRMSEKRNKWVREWIRE